MKKRALISVSDKDGIISFAKKLIENNYEIISTGNTAKFLKENGIQVLLAEDVTGFPECLDGRIKTIHPKIHGGILAIRENPSHMDKLSELSIDLIDIVVINLYPFKNTIDNPEHTLEQAIENIDIGGPTMIRAAAKNYKYVTVVTDKSQYDEVIERIDKNELDEKFNFKLSCEAFSHTATYDGHIANYMNKKISNSNFCDKLFFKFEKLQNLRYGENPHQQASFYSTDLKNECGIEKAKSIHGKELSYNNISDAQGAIDACLEFDEPACVAVKHATPCGVAVSKTPLEAFEKARDCNSIAIFGGIVCFNAEVDEDTAIKLNEIFLEIVIAPSYSQKAIEVLTKKQNLRILILEQLDIKHPRNKESLEFKSVGGGVLIEQKDNLTISDYEKVATSKEPTSDELKDLLFAMKVVKHVKSNAIVIAKNGQTIGIGSGFVSRIEACKHALEQGGDLCKGAVLASDAFFPFSDVVSECAKFGISSIIQPGGSKNDNDSIEECDKSNISMVFTGSRHFKH